MVTSVLLVFFAVNLLLSDYCFSSSIAQLRLDGIYEAGYMGKRKRKLGRNPLRD